MIGINAAIINPGVAMNVGFAIPINLARQVADQIRRSGHVARASIGVSGEDFTAERAAELRVPFTPGALVNAVGRGSPAASAGVQPNDVITEIGGKPVDGFRRLSSTVALSRPGEKTKVVFFRQGRRMEATLTLAGPRGGAGGAQAFGVEVRPMDARDASAAGLPAPGGLVVTAVDPRGPASGVLEEGDLLLMLDGKLVTLARFKALEGKLGRGERATLIIQRGSERFALEL